MVHPRHILGLAALALLTMGMVMVTSAELKGTLSEQGDQATVFDALVRVAASRDVLYYALAVASLAIASVMPWRQIRERVPSGNVNEPLRDVAILGAFTFLILLGLITVYVPGIASPRNASHRWVSFGGFSFQPSEIAKWSFVLLMAWYAAARGELLQRFWLGLVPAVAATGAVAIVVGAEDLGTAALIAGVASLVLIAGGARVTDFVLLAPAGLALGAIGIWVSPYRVQRLIAFLDPYADPQGSGYHIIQSLLAIAGGGLSGRGLGFGVQKLGYLPEGESDFLFAIIAEELGLPGVIALVTIFAALVWAGCTIVRREPDPLLKLVSFGVIATIALQALINFFVVTGLAPTKGIALPLVSHGGTGWVATAFCIGIVCSVERSGAGRARPIMGDHAGEEDSVISGTAEEESDPSLVHTHPEGGLARVESDADDES